MVDLTTTCVVTLIQECRYSLEIEFTELTHQKNIWWSLIACQEMIFQWEWCKWSFDLRSPWYLAYMDLYFGLFSSTPLWDMCEIFWVWSSMHGGCEWSIKNRLLLVRGEKILCDLIGWWLWESLAKVGTNSRNNFYWFINRVIIIRLRYI